VTGSGSSRSIQPSPLASRDLRFHGDNSGGGRNPFSFREFDALPRPVRDTINYATRDLGTRRARMNLFAGRSIAEVCAIERGVALGCSRRDILREYGPHHPFLTEACDA
jgi:hypothetical protein